MSEPYKALSDDPEARRRDLEEVHRAMARSVNFPYDPAPRDDADRPVIVRPTPKAGPPGGPS
jgi:hypothetical protein